jgi:protein disulfide-isomerase
MKQVMKSILLLRRLTATWLATLVVSAPTSAAARRPAALWSASPNDFKIVPVDHSDLVGGTRQPQPGVAPAPESGGNDWQTDFSTALEKAGREKKLVLLNFTGSDWCSWCHRLEADVFSKSGFKAYASKRLVLVKVDFPRKTRLPLAEAAQNARLQQQFGVRGFPTIVVVDANGTKKFQVKGYVPGGPNAFIAALEKQTRK